MNKKRAIAGSCAEHCSQLTYWLYGRLHDQFHGPLPSQFAGKLFGQLCDQLLGQLNDKTKKDLK